MRASTIVCLVLAAFLIGAGQEIWTLRHQAPLTKPIWDDEQLSKANGALIQYLIEKKPEALEYDFRSFFRCTPWPRYGGGGLSCVWGVTFLNEDTQRFKVNMDRFNSPLQVVPLKRE